MIQQKKAGLTMGQEPKLSVFGTVRRLREQRFCMVQSTCQYEFIYLYINYWLKSFVY